MTRQETKVREVEGVHPNGCGGSGCARIHRALRASSGPGCRVQVPGHWGFGRPSLACSSCIMPGCAGPNPWPTGLLLAGTGVPSGLGGLGSGGSADWRSLCPVADSASSSGGGLGGATCCSGVGVLRKDGLERRRWEELRERRTRLRGTERSRRDPGSRASLQLP